MSTKHFIEKLLADPHRPQSHEGKVLPERAQHNYDKVLKEEKVEYRTSRKCILHRPREYRRPIYNNQHPPQHSICHSRPSKCFCSICNHDAPPWLEDPQTPRFIGEVHGYPTHSRRSYSMAARWDPTCFANNSLATRVRQQPCLSSTGGQKRKKRHRTAFTPTQLLGLENAFEQNQYSVGEERKQLASFLGLSETQIKVWFQNRRTKWKRIQKEAEETITDDDEKGNEAKSLERETRYSQYQMYSQCNETSHKSTTEFCACEKMWPTGHVY